MPAKITPIVDGKSTTWAKIQALMGDVSRQQAQAKYRKVAELGPVSKDSLVSRFQSPAVAARKEINANQYTQNQILAHARLNGPPHTAMKFKLDRETVVQLLADNQK